MVDLTAFTAADRNKTSTSLFPQGRIVSSPRAGHSFTKISVERAILFGVVTLENRDEGVDNVFQQTCREGPLYPCKTQSRKKISPFHASQIIIKILSRSCFK